MTYSNDDCLFSFVLPHHAHILSGTKPRKESFAPLSLDFFFFDLRDDDDDDEVGSVPCIISLSRSNSTQSFCFVFLFCFVKEKGDGKRRGIINNSIEQQRGRSFIHSFNSYLLYKQFQ